MTIKNSHVQFTAIENDLWSDLITVLFMCHAFVVTSINLGHVLRDLIRLNCIIMQIVCHYKSLRGLDLLLSTVMDVQGLLSVLEGGWIYILVKDSVCTTVTLCFKIKVKFEFQKNSMMLLLK